MKAKAILITTTKGLVQGLPFAFLAYTAALVWERIFTLFLGLNAWLSLIGVLAVLGVGFGLLNLLMTYVLWFPVEWGPKSFLPQGFILLAVVFPIEILPLHFAIAPLEALGYVAYVAGFVLLNILYAFPAGWVALKLGARWKARGIPQMAEDYVAFTPEPPILADNPKGVHCPRCGGVNLVVAPDNSAYCIDCGRGVRKERLGGAVG